MIMLCFALTLSYMSTFVSYFDNQDNPFLSDGVRQHMVFLLFWSGFYCGYENASYMQVTYPFYILLICVIVERLAQIWIENRFGCSEEQMEVFKEIEAKVKELKQQARKKRLETKSKQDGAMNGSCLEQHNELDLSSSRKNKQAPNE